MMVMLSGKTEKPMFLFQEFKLLTDSEIIGDRKKVKVAVRPEDFILDSNGGEFRVVTQLPTGPAQILNLENGVNEATMVSPDYIKVKPGETIRIGVKDETYNIFDLETERGSFKGLC